MKTIYFKQLPLNYLYLTLKEKPKDENSLLINKERKHLLNIISKRVGKNIKSVYSIYIGNILHFGNQLKLMNNAIFYCEILGCKRLVFNNKNLWFIKNKIIDKKYKMIIELGDKKKYINKNILFDYSKFMYYYAKYIKPEFKVNILKKEILRNIPKMKCCYNDLIIFIRSGDIFIRPHIKYAQPPLCFYEKILKYNKFNKIIIIAKDKNNPLIDILLNKYSNIIYNKNSLKIDLGYLVNSYNLVGCFSTLIYIIIRFNDNLKKFWEYNINIPSVHYIYYKIDNNFTIYSMKPSNNYLKKMKYFVGNKQQLNLMIKEKCINNFQKKNINK